MIKHLAWRTPIGRRALDLARNVQFFFDPLASLSALGRTPADQSAGSTLDAGEAVRRILDAYRASKRDEAMVQPPYVVAGEWVQDIQTRRRDYLEALESDDQARLTQLLANFFWNGGAAGVYWSHESLSRMRTVDRKRLILERLSDYRHWLKSGFGAHSEALVTPDIGNPWGYLLDGRLVLLTSVRHHTYAQTILGLVEDIERPAIAEIGGGFGGAAYFLSRSRPLTYIDFDIPEVTVVATYFLLRAFPEKSFLLYGEAPLDTALRFDFVLMPHFALPDLPDQSVDVFLNTASLSEMDYDTIAEYIVQVERTTRRFFFHENSSVARKKGGGPIEVPAHRFPVNPSVFTLVKELAAPWNKGKTRYRQYLYKKR